MSCAGCDEKARAHAPIDELAALWITAGKLRGFVEGVEWAVRCVEHAAPQLAAASLRTRLSPRRLQAAVVAMGPAILQRVEARRTEALQAESAARQRTAEVNTAAFTTLGQRGKSGSERVGLAERLLRAAAAFAAR